MLYWWKTPVVVFVLHGTPENIPILPRDNSVCKVDFRGLDVFYHFRTLLVGFLRIILMICLCPPQLRAMGKYFNSYVLEQKRAAGRRFHVYDKCALRWCAQKDALASFSKRNRAFRAKLCKFPELQDRLLSYDELCQRACSG